MAILQVVEIIILLAILPVGMGLSLAKKGDSLVTVWASGFVYGWALLLITSIPVIIAGGRLSLLCIIWMVAVIALFVTGMIRYRFLLGKGGQSLRSLSGSKMLSKEAIILLGLFFAIFLFQIYKAIFYVYADGDDAYYISVAQVAVLSDKMYAHDAYTGFGTTVNFRYALAPFPMWIAIISKITGINVAIVAHSIVSPVLIGVSYAIAYSVAKVIWPEKTENRFVLMILVAVFNMFDNVSTSTQGTFLMTRSRQGKAALASIILPFLFLTIYRIVKDNFRIDFKTCLTLVAAGMSGALSSVLGNMLVPIMVFFLIILLIMKKQSIWKILGVALTLVPNALMLLLYVIL